MLKMKLLFIGLSAIVGTCMLQATIPFHQTYESSSFWKEYACTGKNNVNVLKEMFIKDALRWKSKNKIIPEHVFEKASSMVRIATYNVRFWTNCYDKPNFEKIMSVIKEINADILIIQEFAWGQPFNNFALDEILQQFRTLGYVHGGQDTFCIIGPRNRNFGVMILSKFPLEHSEGRHFDATQPNVDREGYVHVVGNVNGKKISVYGTHLAVEFVSKEPQKCEAIRLAQVEQLGALANRDPHEIVVIAGDCNALRLQDYEVPVWNIIQELYQKMFGVPYMPVALDYFKQHGFGDSFDLLKIPTPQVTVWRGVWLDHIFFKKTKTLTVGGSYVYFDAASDHFPVICDVKV